SDPLLGWTVSYTLKRSALAGDTRLRLKGMYWGALSGMDNRSAVASSVRWRVVHTLGVSPTYDSLALLVDAIDADPQPWVRWGAARSVVELAAASADASLSAAALSALAERATTLSETIAAEIAWASQYHGAAGHFRSLMRPVLEVFRASRRNELSANLWEAWVRRFDHFWTTQSNSRVD